MDRLAGRRGVRSGTEASLDRLGLDAVDLLYVHRPRGDYDPETTLPALHAVHEAGLARAVGVSNFEPADVERARELLDAPIAAHQVEFHPHYRVGALLDDAREHGYPIVACSPLIGGAAAEDPTIAGIADARGVSPAAVCIAWALSFDPVVVIPRASSRAHLRANLTARELELTDEEIERISAIDREEQLYPE